MGRRFFALMCATALSVLVTAYPALAHDDPSDPFGVSVMSSIRAGNDAVEIGTAWVARDGASVSIHLHVAGGIRESHVCYDDAPFDGRVPPGGCQHRQLGSDTTVVQDYAFDVDPELASGAVYFQIHVTSGSSSAYAGWAPPAKGTPFFGSVEVHVTETPVEPDPEDGGSGTAPEGDGGSVEPGDGGAGDGGSVDPGGDAGVEPGDGGAGDGGSVDPGGDAGVEPGDGGTSGDGGSVVPDGGAGDGGSVDPGDGGVDGGSAEPGDDGLGFEPGDGGIEPGADGGTDGSGTDGSGPDAETPEVGSSEGDGSSDGGGASDGDGGPTSGEGSGDGDGSTDGEPDGLSPDDPHMNISHDGAARSDVENGSLATAPGGLAVTGMDMRGLARAALDLMLLGAFLWMVGKQDHMRRRALIL